MLYVITFLICLTSAHSADLDHYKQSLPCLSESIPTHNDDSKVAIYKTKLEAYKAKTICDFLLKFSQARPTSQVERSGFRAFYLDILYAIRENRPLKFFLKGFPFKNPARCGKVDSPDRGEYLSLSLLSHIALEISKFH